jgi:pyridoxamine 5'-phosphate oxidase
MDKKEILDFITANPMSNFATVDNNQARVRGMETYRADENGLIYYTGKIKDVYKQVVKNPNVEVCYFAKGTQVRVRGKIELVEDEALKKEIVGKRPFLQQIYAGNYTGMGVMRLKGKATVWSMQNMSAPMTFIDL